MSPDLNSQVIRTIDNSVVFDQFEAYINPSICSDELTASTGYQSQTGSFSGFRHFYFIVNSSLGNKKKRGLGAAIYSSQEGPLISENRLSISYWNKINISTHWFITGGIRAGIINKSLSSTKSTAGANIFVPDISVGTSLNGKQTRVSFSINQIGNIIKTPLTQSIKYQQFITFSAEQSFKLSAGISTRINAQYLHIPKINDNYHATSTLLFNDLYGIGLGAGNSGILCSVVINKVKIKNNILQMTFGTKVPFLNANHISVIPYHIHLNYFFSK